MWCVFLNSVPSNSSFSSLLLCGNMCQILNRVFDLFLIVSFFIHILFKIFYTWIWWVVNHQQHLVEVTRSQANEFKRMRKTSHLIMSFVFTMVILFHDVEIHINFMRTSFYLNYYGRSNFHLVRKSVSRLFCRNVYLKRQMMNFLEFLWFNVKYDKLILNLYVFGLIIDRGNPIESFIFSFRYNNIGKRDVFRKCI